MRDGIAEDGEPNRRIDIAAAVAPIFQIGELCNAQWFVCLSLSHIEDTTVMSESEHAASGQRTRSRVLASASSRSRTFRWVFSVTSSEILRKVRFGATPKPARETHALPNLCGARKLSIRAFTDSFAGYNDF